MQPMVSVSYSDEEFINLIIGLTIKPYAFYIVDSFGVMKRKALRLYYLVDHNLSNDIFVGYHLITIFKWHTQMRRPS